jgi:hypothetical protein
VCFVAANADPSTPIGEDLVGDYLRQWLAHVAGRVRPKTLDGYRGLIRLYASPGLGDLRLSELKALDVQALYSELLGRELSAGTVVNLHLLLTQAFGQAERWGLIPRNPVAFAQPPRPRRPEPAIVDPEIAKRLITTSDGTRFHLPVAIAISTGARSSPFAGRTSTPISRWLARAAPSRPLEGRCNSWNLKRNAPAERWSYRRSSAR